MIYAWQEPYISTLLETDEAKRRVQILETRAALEQRLLSPVDDDELRAMGVAAAALDALERNRPSIAKRISQIRTGRNPRARDLDV
jgi:predicted aminopeptidase